MAGNDMSLIVTVYGWDISCNAGQIKDAVASYCDSPRTVPLFLTRPEA